MGVKQLTCQFYLQRNTPQLPLLFVAPSKSLLFAGLMLRRFMPHIAMLRRAKKLPFQSLATKQGFTPLRDKTRQSCSSREIKRVFFAYFYFAIKKKYVGCRAETRRFRLLINEIFQFSREIPTPKNQNQDRGVAASPPPSFLSRPIKRKQKTAF
ncbi:hypothetical protein [Pelobacter seleniigenes]|uniref:hypothetical protein n=1 Tax=Pelobacter seleniigenes TaxID=407188 RepID=UPI0004A6AE4F|nr:hypothetical protein [Pelobacter seleniigenes]